MIFSSRLGATDMTDDSPHLLTYATRTGTRFPISAILIPIAGILAGLVTLGSKIIWLLLCLAAWANDVNLFDSAYAVYSFCALFAFAFLASVEIVACIGCLWRKQWARIALVWYAAIYLAAKILDFAAALWLYVQYKTGIYDHNPQSYYGHRPTTLEIIKQCPDYMPWLTTITCVLPLLILLLMQRRVVKLAFRKQKIID